MNAAALVDRLLRQGVEFEVIDGDLGVTAPRGVLTPETRVALGANKAAILRLISPTVGAGVSELCFSLGRTVRTPDGCGRLWQVFQDRVGVVLDGLPGRVSFYDPAQVHPLP